MNFNVLGQISKIVSRQITNITKNITRMVKVAAKPFVYLNTYVRAQVKSMTRRPSSKADYVRFGGVYLSKRFLGLSTIAIVLVVTIFSTVVYPWLEGRLWTPTILLNSQKLFKFFKAQRPVVKCRRQTESVFDQRLFAAVIPAEHAADLRQHHMAFVHHQQEIVRKIVQQCSRR